MNPFRIGFLQLVAVAETDAQAERDYAQHIEYFYHKLLHIPLEWFGPPGHQDYQSLANSLRNPKVLEMFLTIKDRCFRDFAEDQFVIVGSPATVRDQLKEAIETLRIGNLMILLQIGSMPHELTLKNTDLFFNEVAPALRDMWDDDWENRWRPGLP